ncbi:MAG: ATP-binding cassette domain-containing protein [Candidatus Dormiibacterota bacterium]
MRARSDPAATHSASPPGPSGDLAVECRGLRFRFGAHVAVDGLDLSVARGEIFGLLGPNGAGKTTTIRVINTLLTAREGTVRVLGYDVRREAMAVRRRLGYVPQQLSVEATLTGRENVSWFARLFDVPRAARAPRVEEALELMGLADAADRLAGTYSGGMIRRLELAQALVNRPQLLVLDEPTVGLDPVARDSVWRRVDQLRRASEATVLLTTHYMEEAEALCDRVALMHLGKVRALGSPAALKAELGPDATLEDVFRHHTGGTLEANGSNGLREVRSTRRTANRLG